MFKNNLIILHVGYRIANKSFELLSSESLRFSFYTFVFDTSSINIKKLYALNSKYCVVVYWNLQHLMKNWDWDPCICLFIIYLKKFFFSVFIYFWDRERQSMNGGGAEREGDTESETGSRLWAISPEPDAGLELTDREIVTWLKSDA